MRGKFRTSWQLCSHLRGLGRGGWGGRVDDVIGGNVVGEHDGLRECPEIRELGRGLDGAVGLPPLRSGRRGSGDDDGGRRDGNHCGWMETYEKKKWQPFRGPPSILQLIQCFIYRT